MRPNTYPNPENATKAELDQAIKASTDRHMTRRLDTMRILLQGRPFSFAVDFSMKNERTVRRWVTQWNTSGIDGLVTRPGRGRKPGITPAQGQVIGAVLQHPQAFGETHWTLLKLQGTIKQAFAIEFGYSTFTHGWCRSREQLPDPLAESLVEIMNDTDRVKSVCAFGGH